MVGAPLAAISRRLPGAAPLAPRVGLSPLVAAGGRRQVSAPPARLLTPSSPAPGLRPRPGPSGRPARGAGGRRPRGRARTEGGRAGPGRVGPGVHLRADVAARGRTAGRSRARWAEALRGRTGRCPGVGVGVGKGGSGDTPPPTPRPGRTPGSGGVGFDGTCP